MGLSYSPEHVLTTFLTNVQTKICAVVWITWDVAHWKLVDQICNFYETCLQLEWGQYLLSNYLCNAI